MRGMPRKLPLKLHQCPARVCPVITTERSSTNPRSLSRPILACLCLASAASQG